MSDFFAHYFTPEEVACQCGAPDCIWATASSAAAAFTVSPLSRQTIIAVADHIRDKCEFPLIVNSALRCPKHPREVAKYALRGKHWRSSHSSGWAIDIRMPDTFREQEKLFFHVNRMFFHSHLAAVGIHDRFLHIDIGHPDLQYLNARKRGVAYAYKECTSPRFKHFAQHLDYIAFAR